MCLTSNLCQNTEEPRQISSEHTNIPILKQAKDLNKQHSKEDDSVSHQENANSNHNEVLSLSPTRAARIKKTDTAKYF